MRNFLFLKPAVFTFVFVLGAAGFFVLAQYYNYNFPLNPFKAAIGPAVEESLAPAITEIESELFEEPVQIKELETQVQVGAEAINQEQSLAEIQEQLDDISEKVDILDRGITELAAAQPQQQPQELIEELQEDKINQEKEEVEDDTEIIEEDQVQNKIESVGQEIGQNLCEKIEGSNALIDKVIINEITWMGTENSANDEWIELKNISGVTIDLVNWQLTDKDQQIQIIFTSGVLSSANSFFLLERTDDNSVSGIQADFIYTGGLNNTDEALYLFDENCQLQDEVAANPDWPAGDNSSKRTMERKSDFNWQTSAYSGGTPKSENSSGYYIAGGGGGVVVPLIPEPLSSVPPQILITEIQIETADSADYDFIELYNFSATDLDISNFQLKKKNSSGNESSIRVFPENSIIPAQSYFLWLNFDYALTGLILADATSSQTLAKNNSIALLDKDKNIIDAVAWGASEDAFLETLAFSENPTENQTLARKWSTTTENYLDANNNQDDFEIQNPSPGAKNESPQPILEVFPDSLSFSVQEDGENPASQSLIIENRGLADLNWEISAVYDEGLFNWLLPVSNSGILSKNSSSTIEISVSINDLPSGIYTAFATIEDLSGANNPKEIPVILTISSQPKTVVINEVQLADSEFVELYNFGDSVIDISSWYFSYFSSERDWDNPYRNKKFPDQAQIPAQGYYLIGLKDYPIENGDPNSDWQPYFGNTLSNESGAVAIFPWDPTMQSTSTAFSDRIDALGWGEVLVKEGIETPASSQDQSIERIDKNIDTNNNSFDFVIQTISSPTNSQNQTKNQENNSGPE